jgi:hypothetical protein
MTHRESFDFGEIPKKPHAKAARGLFADKSNEVRRHHIVAIEFFFDRAILLGQVNGRANSGNQHEIVGIAGDTDRDRARVWVGR